MAIDLFSETSPRISFSHDLLGQTDFVPINNNNSRSDTSLLDSTSSEDFEFGISNNHEHESSSADELFSDGVILPIQILKKTATPKQAHPIFSLPPRPEPPSSSSSSCWSSENSKEKPQAKSFWSFKRSSSLNCENGHKRSLLCSLPLLSRSNSTGSVPNPKRTTMSSSSSSSSKDTLKQNPYKLLPSISMSKSASSSTTSFYTYPLQQKQTTKKKNYGGSSSSSSSSSYGGVRISPVLNVPPPYISKSTANLFGLASFFGNGKDHNNKKNKK